MNNREPQLTALFCDSVRQEVGGTQSFIGVYQDQILFKSFPVGFSRLSVFMSLHAYEDVFDSVAFEVFEEGTGEVMMGIETGNKDQLRERLKSVDLRLDRGVRVAATLEAQNIQIDSPTVIGVRCRLGDGREFLSRTKLEIKQA